MSDRKIPFGAIRSILDAAGIDPGSVSTIAIDASHVVIGQLLDATGVPAQSPSDIDIQNGQMREMKTTFAIDFTGAAKAIAHQEERQAAFRRSDITPTNDRFGHAGR